VTYPLAFLAGIVSFLSPCVLPIVPSYLSLVTGMSFDELTAEDMQASVRMKTLLNSGLFVLGFSTVFILMGAAFSFAGQVLLEYQSWLRIAGGILVITLGLFFSGIIKLDFLMRERKMALSLKQAGPVGTFFTGVGFASGWTPCIGPILGTILMVSSAQGSTSNGISLLVTYSLGLGLPFMVSAFAFNSFLSHSKKVFKYMRYIKAGGGVILIIFGVLMLTDNISYLATLFPDWFYELMAV
jgi:cytochrome c-type biogenesis protein